MLSAAPQQTNLHSPTESAPKYYRATKWLTVLIFRPLTGKSKKNSRFVFYSIPPSANSAASKERSDWA
jgi:hypothetical protein